MSAPLQNASDLAPGDFGSADFDWTGFDVHRIRSADDPKFDEAYEFLWHEFHAKHELEERDVLARRLEWPVDATMGRFAMLYEMILVEQHGQIAGVRDQTAIVSLEEKKPYAIVHLSHVLVTPKWRGKGLAGWLRAWPIQTARACLHAVGFDEDVPMTLVAEMEHFDANDRAVVGRLTAYERAGFLKIDPRAVPYHQPDFRSPDVIDQTGGPKPLPMSLVVRCVKKEDHKDITGQNIRRIVDALYHMYAFEFRAQDMVPMFEQLKGYPPADARIAMVPPTDPS